ncbi:MAG: phage tail assembly protein [Candidatus Reddybacter sp.]
MTVKNSTVKVTLSKPIKRGDKDIADITLRKPDTGSLRGCSLSGLLTSSVDDIVVLLPRITQPMLTDVEVAKLDPKDLVSFAGEIISFLT